jgi:hypothetical protein
MPPLRGELGYREHQVRVLEAGRCGCHGCSGTLTDLALSPSGWGFCRSCGRGYHGVFAQPTTCFQGIRSPPPPPISCCAGGPAPTAAGGVGTRVRAPPRRRSVASRSSSVAARVTLQGRDSRLPDRLFIVSVPPVIGAAPVVGVTLGFDRPADPGQSTSPGT